MSRVNFEDHEYRGGRIAPEGTKRQHYACFAEQCPMPGTIFTNGTDKAGVCVWHYGVVGADVPRVTRVLRDWGCASYEVNEARRTLTDPDIATHPGLIAERFETAWARLQPQLHGQDEAVLRPVHHEDYGQWAKRVEAFIGGRVVEALGVRAPRRIERPSRARTFAEPQPVNAGEAAQELLG